ncbi:MAG: luciferase family protein [Bacteroidota bacterium]
MSVSGAEQRIREAALAWSGVTVHPYRFGGVEFRFGKRELGHIHGNSLLDLPFPMNVRNELVETGLVQPHHVLPQSGWVSFYIRSGADVELAIALLKSSYSLAVLQKKK